MNERVYCLLLHLYPAELRHAFGAEMTQVFLDDIEDTSAARVWWRAVKELLRIALPAAFSRRYVQVPVTMYLLMVAYFGSMIMWAPRDANFSPPHSVLDIVALMTFPGLGSAITALVALYTADRAVPDSLSIR